MKIQTKILVLLAFVVVLFLAGLFALNSTEYKTLRIFQDNLAKQSELYFDKIVSLKGESLEIFAYDYTYWDEMVTFISTKSLRWASENVDEGMKTYKCNAIWIYGPDLSPVYSVEDKNSRGVSRNGPAKEVLARLLAVKWFNHFFMWTPAGLLEVRTAPIQPASDMKRITEPRGYFVVGRLWTAEFVKSIADATETVINVGTSEEEAVNCPAKSEQHKIHFVRMLPGWDGTPAAEMCVCKPLGVLADLEKASTMEILYSLMLAVVIFGLLYYHLMRWINIPLKVLMESLETKDLSRLDKIKNREVELVKIAALMKESDKLQNQLMQASKLASMGTMAGGVAHELNNPLTGILGFAQVLKKTLPAGSKESQDAARIEELAGRCRDIVQSLLAFARHESVQLSLVNVNIVINMAMEIMGEHLRTSSIAVEQKLADPLPKVNANTIQLRQVFLNIIANAQHAMKGGGKLTVSSSHEGFNVVIRFQDTGVGMEKEQLARIFDPFYTTKPVGQGVGLGLSLSHGIITALGGVIEAESAPGSGTTFTIKLPAAGK